MTLWRLVPTKHLKRKNTPDFMKEGVGKGANLHGDLGSLIEHCRENYEKQRKQYSIGMVKCGEDDVERNYKYIHSEYKTRHYIKLAEPYILWQEAKTKYQGYLNDNGTEENY